MNRRYCSFEDEELKIQNFSNILLKAFGLFFVGTVFFGYCCVVCNMVHNANLQEVNISYITLFTRVGKYFQKSYFLIIKVFYKPVFLEVTDTSDDIVITNSPTVPFIHSKFLIFIYLNTLIFTLQG